MSIEQDILRWDGKSSSDIASIYSRYCNDDALPSMLVALSQKPTLLKGTTWLIKRYLEDGKTLALSDVAVLFQQLPEIRHWEAKLHILQSLPFLTIGKSEQSVVESFIRTCITDNNKFVRAWAYSGLYELACQYPEYKPEVVQFFEMALADEAASVKARIRKIIKAGF